jgi:hypothetical protein
MVDYKRLLWKYNNDVDSDFLLRSPSGHHHRGMVCG